MLVKGVNPMSVSVQSGKTYEEEFDIETQRAKVHILLHAGDQCICLVV